LQDERTLTSRALAGTAEKAQLTDEAAAVFNWLVGVCHRSELAEDQIFIFRDMGRLTKVFRFDRRGEIKAIGMTDLRRVGAREFKLLRRLDLVTVCKGHWPGVWFRVNPANT
jgi:hypothetical protein